MKVRACAKPPARREHNRQKEDARDKNSARPRQPGIEFRQTPDQTERARHSAYNACQSPQPEPRSRRRRYSDCGAGRFDAGIHQTRIKDLKDMIRPGRQHQACIGTRLEAGQGN